MMYAGGHPEAPVAEEGPALLGGGIRSAFPLPTLASLPASPPRPLPRPAARERYPPGLPSKIGFSDGGNRRDWFPGVRGRRAASCATWNHTNGEVYPFDLTLALFIDIF